MKWQKSVTMLILQWRPHQTRAELYTAELYTAELYTAELYTADGFNVIKNVKNCFTLLK